MYPEFIPIYIGIGVIIILNIIILILVIVGNKKRSDYSMITGNNFQPDYNREIQPTGGVVFCKNCATQFDSSQSICPKCGLPR